MGFINMCKGFAFKPDLVSLNFISVPITPIFLVGVYAESQAV